MQRLMPAIEDSDGHHSSFIRVFLKTEKDSRQRVAKLSREGLARVGPELGNGLDG
jgi:hypothetical protein